MRDLATILTLFISLTITGNIIAQGSYAGTEPKLEYNTLLEKAKATNFNNELSAKVHQDQKNTYYAIDVSKLKSEYEQIRLLELSYNSTVIVNTGNDRSSNYYLFLVNNTLDKTDEEIFVLFDNYSQQSKTEMLDMTGEQMRLWLIQHDKYSKK